MSSTLRVAVEEQHQFSAEIKTEPIDPANIIIKIEPPEDQAQENGNVRDPLDPHSTIVKEEAVDAKCSMVCEGEGTITVCPDLNFKFEDEDDFEKSFDGNTSSSDPNKNDNKVTRACAPKDTESELGPSLPKRKREHTPAVLSCPFCLAVFPYPRTQGKDGPVIMRWHVLHDHGETHFKNHKLPNVTDLQFKRILVDLLFHDLIDGRTCCAFCPKRVTLAFAELRRNRVWIRRRFHLHYLDSHYDKLVEKLMLIQSDPNLPETLDKYNSKGKVCSCGVYFSSVNNWAGHYKSHCNLRENNTGNRALPLTIIPTSSKSRVACRLCGKVVSPEYAMAHVEKYCRYVKDKKQPLTNKSEVEVEVTPEDDPLRMDPDPLSENAGPVNGNSLELPNVNEERCKPVTSYIPILPKPSLPVSTTSPPGSDIINKDYLLSPSSKPIFSLKEDKTYFMGCPHCRAEFALTNDNHRGMWSVLWLLRHHFIDFHPEIFFPAHKRPSITNQEFLKILAELLFKGLVERTSCLYCDKGPSALRPSYLSLSTQACHFKFHYLQYHYSELETRLIQFQEGAYIKEELTLFNSREKKFCRCGVYLPNRSSAVTHQSHCILEEAGKEDELESEPEESKKSNPKRPQNKMKSVHSQNLQPTPTPSMITITIAASKEDIENASTCAYCKVECKPIFMQKHLANFHPEHFLLDARDEERGVTMECFRKILNKILFSEFLPKDGTDISCKLCGLEFLGKTVKDKCELLNKHLVLRHEKDLKERLRDIQKDPNLGRKLMKCCEVKDDDRECSNEDNDVIVLSSDSEPELGNDEIERETIVATVNPDDDSVTFLEIRKET